MPPPAEHPNQLRDWLSLDNRNHWNKVTFAVGVIKMDATLCWAQNWINMNKLKLVMTITSAITLEHIEQDIIYWASCPSKAGTRDQMRKWNIKFQQELTLCLWHNAETGPKWWIINTEDSSQLSVFSWESEDFRNFTLEIQIPGSERSKMSLRSPRESHSLHMKKISCLARRLIELYHLCHQVPLLAWLRLFQQAVCALQLLPCWCAATTYIMNRASHDSHFSAVFVIPIHTVARKGMWTLWNFMVCCIHLS